MSHNSAKLPTTTRVVVVKGSPADRKPLYHDAVLEERPIAPLKPGELLVRIGAVAFNRRDIWIRTGQYPGIEFGRVFGSDGAGTVIASADPNDSLLNSRVFLTPSRGWEKHPDAPESKFGMLGGVSYPSLGTFSSYVVVSRDEVIPSPPHLDDIHMAAWPLGSVTAWRAAVINARVERGQNVLITGIGGGVALLAMKICIAKGAKVWVTSGSKEKLRKAVDLGAKGGVNYNEEDWPAQLATLLERDNEGTGHIDAVIDSAGGDLLGQTGKILKQGGRVVSYGMTVGPNITFTVQAILRNQKLIGSTMGSRQDLIDATNFLAEHKIVPVVSHVFEGLESAEKGFETIRHGEQFGKVILKLSHDEKVDETKLRL